MEHLISYGLIILLQVCGILLHVLQKIIAFGNDNKGMKRSQIISIFWDEDWDTLCVSIVVLVINLAGHFIVGHYTKLDESEYYPLFAFGTALLLGYIGQRKIYQYLGTAEEFLDKQVKNKLG